MKPAVGIASMGAVCCAGTGVTAGYDAVACGRDGLSSLALFDSGLARTPLCAQVRDGLGDLLDFSDGNKTLAMALCAAEEAMAAWDRPAGIRLGVVFATTIAGMPRSEAFYRNYIADPATLRNAGRELALHEATALSARICSRAGGQGFHTVSTACSTSLHAIGLASRLVKSGMYDACLAVGSDALSILTVRGFASLTLLDPGGCRPFDSARAGISLGEGAGAMLLVSPALAAQRPYLAGVAGWGASADAFHMTAPHPQGDGAYRAMAAALDEAGLDTAAVDFIVTHGTGTPDNDKAETAALSKLFGAGAIPPFCSMKRSLGHTLAASGILEAVFAVHAMNHDTVTPTAGFTEIDPEIGIAPSPRKISTIRACIKNAFGFGGNNASVVFTREGAAK